MKSALRVIVVGIAGRMPFAGVAWQVLHYLEGFRRLGHEVYYVEDNGDWPYDPDQNAVTDDPGYTVNYLARVMAWCGLADRWAYRSAPQQQTFGLSESRVEALFRDADVLVNVTGATVLGARHLRVPVRIFLETDPVLPQIEVALGQQFTIDLLRMHTHYFTFGENLGAPDCPVPLPEEFAYHPTRQPVVLDWWQVPYRRRGASFRFTTIASWRQSGKDIEWRGEVYTWSKHHEFVKFMDLPGRGGQRFELALANVDQEAKTALTAAGWRVVDALAVSRDLEPYRSYIQASDGEFTVAKAQYYRPHSGWFSDRSACYLAAGLPVITQDTAFGNILPTGRGLFAFRSEDDILAALDAIASDPDGHRQAAREIATEWFSAEKVLRSLLDRAGL